MTPKESNRTSMSFVRRSNLLLIVFALVAMQSSGFAGWTPLKTGPIGPNGITVNIQLMLLLSDGTVMASDVGTSRAGTAGWYKLTPDKFGSYVNGTWSALAPMASTRLFFSSCVLRDGRVLVAGGEYGNGSATSEIYDPVANIWSQVTVPTNVLNPTQPSPALSQNPVAQLQGFVDSGSVILPDGRVLAAPVGPETSGTCLIYSPGTNAWATGPSYVRGVYQDEASWVKLPDDSILTIDPFGQNSERYIPSSNSWINDGTVPVPMYDAVGKEIGPAFLLDDGRAFFMGGTGNSAFYTPSASLANRWATGPVLPPVTQYPLDNNGAELPGSATTVQGCPPDAAGAMMITGNILCAFSGPLYTDPREGTTPVGATNNFWSNKKPNAALYPAPTSFFEYNRVTNTFLRVGAPTPAGASTLLVDDIPAFNTCMLDLPDGTVLYAHQGPDLYVYTPSGSSLPAGKPTIANISANADGYSFHLTGTLLNGISQGAAYGDDWQMDSNYPIVQIFDSTTSTTTYGKTFNWSSTGVATGSKVVSTEFYVPGNVFFNGPHAYSLRVVANGNSSDPFTFAGPVWVDFNFTGTEAGTFAAPYKTLHAALNAASALPVTGRMIRIKGPASSAEVVTTPITFPVTIVADSGSVTIGHH